MKNLSSNERLAIGLCLGLGFGTLIDNLAWGLILGVAFGCISKVKDKSEK